MQLFTGIKEFALSILKS